MASRKHSLIIDGNFFLHKTLFVLPRNKKHNLMDSEDDELVFMQKLSQDIAAEVRKFSSVINRVVFTVDSSSWRKDFYPAAAYKGHRVSDNSVNWEKVWKIFSEFVEILKSKNVIVLKVPGAEGDDLVFAWSKFLNLKGENAIINSGDRDLTQLVTYEESTDSYTLFYTNTQKVLIGYPGFIDWLNKPTKQAVDIFNMSQSVTGKDAVKDTFNNLINKNTLKLSEVNGDEVVLQKVLSGDKGDNVMPAYYYVKENKDGKSRTYGVSDKKVEVIKDLFEKRYGAFKTMHLFDQSVREYICGILIDVLGVDKSAKSSVLSNIESNMNLVILHSSIIPKPIQEQMFKNVEMMYSLQNCDISQISSKDVILKGTKYEKEIYTPSSYNVFGKKEKYDMSFIKKDKKDIKDNNHKSLF